MKIIVIGSTGMLGQAVTTVLKAEHEVIGASRRSSISVNLDNPRTIDQMFSAISNIDAVVCCAANVPLTPLAQISDDTIVRDLQVSCSDK